MKFKSFKLASPARHFALMILSVVFLGTAIAPATAQSNPCTGVWTNMDSKLKKAIVSGLGVAQLFASGNISKPGSRWCKSTYSVGRVLTQQRYFFDSDAPNTPLTQVAGQRFHLDLEIRDGMATAPLNIHVCLFDDNHNLRRHFTETINGAQANIGRKFYKRTYGNATGLIPVILLSKPVGTRGYLYRITCSESG